MENTPYDAAMTRSKQELARQLVDANARIAALEAALRKATDPCGECHLQPGERCDICGRRAALAPEQDK